MLIKIFCFLNVYLMVVSLYGQKTITGKSLINYEKLKYWSQNQEGLGGTKSNKAKLPEDIELTFTTEVHPDFIYNLSSRVPLKSADIASGEILFLSFVAKTIRADLETGEARSLWMLNVSDNPKDRIRNTFSLSSEWQQYYWPVKVEKKISAKELALAVQYGFPPQEFLIKNLKLEVFDKNTNLSDLPKTRITYMGMEPEAEWRKEAAKRIEKHRKGDFKITFTHQGKAIKNFPIELNLLEHHFSWGAAVNAKKILNDELYLNHFSDRFNLAVFENDLKIKRWGRAEKQAVTLKAIDRLRDRNRLVKGHVLLWPGFRHLTPAYKRNEDNPAKITKMISDHVTDILDKTKGKVDRWDVVNEAYTNQDLQRITGSEEILYNGFRMLAEKSPEVIRYTNEYGIISKGGLDGKKQKWYYDYIKRIDENTNGLVDGIGIQCHIGSDLTPPQKVLKILDYYAELDKKISISEFTMDIKDPATREIYTHDFLMAAFSHPSVDEFLFWGIQTEKADLFQEDWSLGSMGKAYDNLVFGQWQTNISDKTNGKGCVSGRGFYGKYEYKFIQGNKVLTGTFDFNPDTDGMIKIEVQ